MERYQGRSGGGAEEPVTGRGARGGGRRGAQAEKAGESRRGRHRASQQTQEELEADELRRLEEELARLTQQELEASAPSATVEPSPGPASDTGETAHPPVPRRVVRFRAPEEGDHGMAAVGERPPADETPAPAPEERDTETPDAPPPPAVLPFPFVVLSPLAPADHAAADVGCSATADARGGPELVATEGLFVAPDSLRRSSRNEVLSMKFRCG